MMLETPIDVGALYEYTDEHNPSDVRVLRVWVDEDKQTHVVTTEYDTKTLDELVEKIESGELVRVNSDHEAWRWRNQE